MRLDSGPLAGERWNRDVETACAVSFWDSSSLAHAPSATTIPATVSCFVLPITVLLRLRSEEQCTSFWLLKRCNSWCQRDLGVRPSTALRLGLRACCVVAARCPVRLFHPVGSRRRAVALEVHRRSQSAQDCAEPRNGSQSPCGRARGAILAVPARRRRWSGLSRPWVRTSYGDRGATS